MAARTARSSISFEWLNELLDIEMYGSLATLLRSDPYVDPPLAQFYAQLRPIAEQASSRAAALSVLIQDLGGAPAERPARVGEQYLSFLSLRFVLPGLLAHAELDVRRYEEALRALAPARPAVERLLQSHLAEHRRALQLLRAAATDAAPARGMSGPADLS